ncbi:hypothetical protein BSFA1_81550 (plasmid) [Burkholderia sp. SFA1]|nr:hypothetical protein BSFA1_81550 [Burkholderia sp. SFA1]
MGLEGAARIANTTAEITVGKMIEASTFGSFTARKILVARVRLYGAYFLNCGDFFQREPRPVWLLDYQREPATTAGLFQTERNLACPR